MKKYDPSYMRELMNDANHGDGDAFASLYGITYKEQYNYAYRRLRDIYLTQDAVTETYIEAHRREKPVGVPVEKWLMSINREICDHTLRYHSESDGVTKRDYSTRLSDDEIPQLDDDTAEQMLYNIIDTLGLRQNAVSLENLMTYSSYRQQRGRLMRTIVVVIIALLFFVPFRFISPTMTLEKTSNADEAGRPVYTVTVDSQLKTFSVRASIGGVQMPVYQEGANLYTVRPTKNGKMTVIVTSENNRTASMTVTVDTSDTKPPKLVTEKVNSNGTVSFVFKDDENRIRFDQIEATDQNGMMIDPVSTDADTGEVIFDYPSEKITINVPDATGNTLHLVVTP